MCATAEKVVPRSMPTALRSFIFGEVTWADSPAPFGCNFRAALASEFWPFGVETSAASETEIRSLLMTTQRGHFFGPQNISAPDKAAFNSRYNSTVLLRANRHLISDDPVFAQINEFSRFYFGHLETMKYLHQCVNGICQIILPAPQAFRFSSIGRCFQLGS